MAAVAHMYREAPTGYAATHLDIYSYHVAMWVSEMFALGTSYVYM